MRERLERVIAERIGDRKGRRVQLIVTRLVRRAGIVPDTFYRKLEGRRQISRADLGPFARAFGLNLEWLASGRGPRGGDWAAFVYSLYLDARALDLRGDGGLDGADDGHASDLPVVTTRWGSQYRDGVDPRVVDPLTGRLRRGRPRREPRQPYGSRVTGVPKAGCRRLNLDEMVTQLRATPEDLRLFRVWDLVDAELDEPDPRRDVLELLLGVTKHLTGDLPPEFAEAARVLETDA